MIREATIEGVAHVAASLRPDEIVVKQLGREEAAQRCIDVATSSDWRWQVMVDGVPAALFGGDANPGDDECSVWLFCTDLVERAPLELFRGIRTCVAWGKQHWPTLVIEAEPRSERQKRFLRMLGFKPRASFSIGDVIYEELAI